MKYLWVGLFLLSPLANAALEMNPGLWNVNMVIKANGKVTNPSAEMQKAMANMPAAQKKQMMAMMAKMQPNMGSNGSLQVCYNKASLEKPGLMQEKEKKCTTSVITNTPKKIVTNFKCADGTTGVATWIVNSQTSYKGVVNMKSPKGEKSEINYDAKFAKADCGKVRPVL